MAERRTIDQVPAQPARDGAGVRLNRSLGTARLPMLDPFLMLDEFYTDDPDDYIAGFPDHPHRGFETVTYMLHGRMAHRDSTGRSGLLTPGSVQWMTAGRGIVHSEMPEQEAGMMWGFQLWVNLPAKLKMVRPRYQDIPADQVPEVAFEGGSARVLAGTFREVTGPVEGVATEPTMLDVSVEAETRLQLDVKPGHNAFAYVFDGAGRVGGAKLPRGTLAVLGDGDHVRVRAGAKGMRMLLLAARPIGEPVERYGPFVMNTREQIAQAFADYRGGRF